MEALWCYFLWTRFKVYLYVDSLKSVLSCSCVVLITIWGGKIHVIVICHGPNNALLVPDSCRVTVRNDNSIKHGLHRKHHWKLFQTIWNLFLDFFISQNKRNIRALSVKVYKINLHSIRHRPEKLAKWSFLSAGTHTFYVFWQCTYKLLWCLY